jgi:serine/threonine protein kinase
MDSVFEEYGCNINRFTDLNNLKVLINKFNRFYNIENIEYKYCKDDADGFILVTNNYVIKLYLKNMYQKIIYIYSIIKNYNNIEKIYYYYSISDGVIYESYHYYDPELYKFDKSIDIRGTINELLIPIFDISDYENIKSDITWDNKTFKKLLLDVADALHELHKNGITHGDTTPDNIGLRPSDNNFVLFDFGNAVINNRPINGIQDVNRFLDSLVRTFDKFFINYKLQIETIKILVNNGSDFRDAILSIVL